MTKNTETTSLAVVDDKQRKANASVLQPVLVDLIAFTRIVKQLHWNVIGPSFRPIHLHLDEIYEEFDEFVDTVAERLSATGTSPAGRIRDVSDQAQIEDIPAGFLQDQKVVELAASRILKLGQDIRAKMGDIETEDTVTADLLHQVVATLEKHHWMLQAQQIRL